MQVWSLRSGSSGNCYLVREGDSLLLLEAGLSARRLEGELARLGFTPSDLTAIVASHEHTDHWLSAVALARRLDAPLLCTSGTMQAAASSPRCAHVPVEAGRPTRVGRFWVEPFPLPHDAREPVGFIIRSDGGMVCLATDMGVATDEMVERAGAADLVILEANHDVGMLMRGSYPAHLKARILGDRGHLSNEESGRTIVRLARGQPRCFWLAHLSRNNNTPALALSSIRSTLHREGLSHLQVSVALRDRRSLFWDSAQQPAPRLEQLPLF